MNDAATLNSQVQRWNRPHKGLLVKYRARSLRSNYDKLCETSLLRIFNSTWRGHPNCNQQQWKNYHRRRDSYLHGVSVVFRREKVLISIRDDYDWNRKARFERFRKSSEKKTQRKHGARKPSLLRRTLLLTTVFSLPALTVQSCMCKSPTFLTVNFTNQIRTQSRS